MRAGFKEMSPRGLCHRQNSSSSVVNSILKTSEMRSTGNGPDVPRWAVHDRNRALRLGCYQVLLPKMRFRNYGITPRPQGQYSSLLTSVFHSLSAEVKAGEQGLSNADRQNIHSASITVKGVLELFKAAFGDGSKRVRDLYGQVLVFTVSHDNDSVRLYGHYATINEADELNIYRYNIAMISLSAKDGADRFVAYNFVRNVCDKFAPAHRRRIQDIIRCKDHLKRQSLGNELTNRLKTTNSAT